MACVKACKTPLYFVRHGKGSFRHCRYFCSTVGPTENHNISPDSGDKRDISRLPDELSSKMKHRLKLRDSDLNVMHGSTEEKMIYNRRLFAKYGKMSGVNPGIMWPSIDEFKEIIEDEQQWDKPLSEMVEAVEARKTANLNAMIEKDKLIEKKMKEMPKHIEKYRQQLRNLKVEEEQWRQRQNKLLEKAREFFGFDISRHDLQFKAYVENQKEEEAKLRKKQKKEMRAAKRKARDTITGEDTSTAQTSDQVEQENVG